jgi:PAS domain S-box-containing protein
MWKTRFIAFLTASLQRKLMLALMALVTVVIGTAGIYLLSTQQKAALAGLEARATHMTNLLSKSLAGPLWNIDMKSIQDQLEMVMMDPDIYSVTVSQQNQPLASKKRDGQAIDGIEREAPVIYVRDLPLPPVELGKVHIVYTLTYMYQAVGKTRMMILTGLLLLIASLFVATYLLLTQMVEKPIQELLAIVYRITNGDFEAKMPVRSGDEIGLLGEGVNYMTDKLKQTMDSLIRSEQNYRAINETLESSVQERTDELHGRTVELQKHIAELGKVRKDTLNILEDLEVSKKETEATMQKIDAMSQEQTAIFESLTLGIAFVKDRIILRGNAKLGELFGRSLDEMVGQTTRIWYKNEEEYLGIGASTYEDLKRQPIHQREQELPRKDGSLFWCLFRVRALDAQNISQGIVCTLEDITERKRAEKELKERMEELERFMRLTINREKKMIQLKAEINKLLQQTDKEQKYKIVA